MQNNVNLLEQEWSKYYQYVLTELAPVFTANDIVLDTVQPHVTGERFLMQAVNTTNGRKLILSGTCNGEKAILKVANEKNGIAEIEHERLCRSKINDIDFAGEYFSTPPELAYIKSKGFVIAVQKFIVQDITFLERPLIEQFTYALNAFKAQESAHVATYSHARSIRGVFAIRSAEDYLINFASFIKNIEQYPIVHAKLLQTMKEAETLLNTQKEVIAQYCGFLTHTDFVPHNIRIHNGEMYLLDYSSLIFGNKYEGWARFLNFMVLYNRPLERALITYVAENRTPEESHSLKLMRIYRLGEILWYYVRTLEKSSADLLTLNTARVLFWGDVLAYKLKDEDVPEKLIGDYQKKRDFLRSEEEKTRQKGLH